MNKIIPLKIKYDFNGKQSAIYPVIAYNEKDMILIDCGFPNFLNLIEKASMDYGINLDKLTKIIITHHDYDHIGSLADFKRKYPSVQILSSSIEAQYISRYKKLLRVELAEAGLNKLSKEEQILIMENIQRLDSVERVEVDQFLEDKDFYDWCGGIEVITTPGHTPGHICIYFQEMKTLVSGDAISIISDELDNANPIFTLDMDEARNSIKKFLNYDIQKIITYHYGVFEGDIKAGIKKITEGKK